MLQFLGLTIDGNRVTFGRDTKTLALESKVAELETKSAANFISDGRGWFPLIRESFAGAWQKNIHVDQNLALSFHAVFACVTLIASSIAMLRMKLVEKDANSIWTETSSPAYSPVLIKPNGYQTRIQFWENYIISKLLHGNTYVLKERDNRNVVTDLYVLDPRRCRPMVAGDGSVWYELEPDNLNGVFGDGRIMVPAREIIHDRMHGGMFHSLCGVSPIYANGLAAIQGLNIQQNSARFFGNNSQPGGILTVEGNIAPATAELMKKQWEENYAGKNLGRIAVFGGGLKFVPLAMTATDAQLIEQLKWSAEVVCGVFHVPAHMLNVGPQPLNNNVQALQTQYYQQCLQKLIEDAEVCMDEGLGIGEGVSIAGRTLGTEFDIDTLLRMDTESQMRALKDSAGWLAPNEGRKKLNLPPTPGGETPYLQEQNWPLALLANRELPSRPPTAPIPIEPPPLAPDQAKSLDFEDVELYSMARCYKELGIYADKTVQSVRSSEAAL